MLYTEAQRDLPSAGARVPSQILEYIRACDPPLRGWSAEVRRWLAEDRRPGAQESSSLVNQWREGRDLGFDLLHPLLDSLEHR